MPDDIKQSFLNILDTTILHIFSNQKDKANFLQRLDEKINNPENHKTVIGLIELIKKMDELIPSAWVKIICCFWFDKILYRL